MNLPRYQAMNYDILHQYAERKFHDFMTLRLGVFLKRLQEGPRRTWEWL